MGANFSVNMGVTGRYRLQVKKKDGRVVKDTGWFNNIITRGGFYKLSDNDDSAVRMDTNITRYTYGLTTCQVGAGNSTPSIEDDSLDSYIAHKTGLVVVPNGSTANYDSENPELSYHSAVLEWEFGEGVAAGNISEVAVGYGFTGPASPPADPYIRGGYQLFSRALVRDQLGNPTAITVLSDEFLNVKYEIRLYPFLNGATVQNFDATIEGQTVPTTITIVPKGFNYTLFSFVGGGESFRNLANSESANFNTRISASNTVSTDILESRTLGTEIDDNDGIYPLSASYNSTAFEITYTFSLIPSEGNHIAPSAIGKMTFNNWSNYFSLAMYFDPPIAKDATKSFSISFKLKWSNYEPA